jgi:hypothetical protein
MSRVRMSGARMSRASKKCERFYALRFTCHELTLATALHCQDTMYTSSVPQIGPIDTLG